LKVAGAKDPIFTPAACSKIFSVTRGVPRLINQICDFSLLYAYTENMHEVTQSTVDQVLSDGVFFAGGVTAD
jgi:type II secretory pathway predicted ATPase ExeA